MANAAIKMLYRIGRSSVAYVVVASLYTWIAIAWIGVEAGRRDANEYKGTARSEIMEIAHRTGLSPQAVADSLARRKGD